MLQPLLQQAIEPDPDSIMRPLHIVPGGEASLARKIRSKRRGAVVSAALGLAVVAIYLLVFLRPDRLSLT